jgi:hypothetical protein
MSQGPNLHQVCEKCCLLFSDVGFSLPRYFQRDGIRALLCKTVDQCHLGSMLFANIEPPYRALLFGDTKLQPRMASELFTLCYSDSKITFSGGFSGTIFIVYYTLLKDRPAISKS